MTPYFLGQISPNPLVEGDQYPFTIASDATSFSFPILFSNPQDQGVGKRDHHTQQILLQQERSFDPLLIGGSSNRPASSPSINNGDFIERDPYVRAEDPRGSGKWMSSKMRIMRKMMNSDRIVVSNPRTSFQALQDQLQPNRDGASRDTINNSSCGGIIRVCSDCNTTKTPLWRSGPRGPKSLCNACGIRQRKARRAMAAAAAGDALVPAEKPNKVRKEKRSEVDRTVPFKKRYKIAAAEAAQKKLRFDDITISLGKDSAFHRVFPQDERDAAVLLMALSCGLISS